MAILPFINAQGGSTTTTPLNLFAGAYVPTLGKFIGAVAGVATLTVNGQAIAGTIDANQNFVPTVGSQLPVTTGAFAAALVAGADTSTVYVNIAPLSTPCSPTVADFSTPILDRKNASITGVNGQKQRVLLSVDKFASNALAIASGLEVGDLYLNATNVLTAVV